MLPYTFEHFTHTLLYNNLCFCAHYLLQRYFGGNQSRGVSISADPTFLPQKRHWNRGLLYIQRPRDNYPCFTDMPMRISYFILVSKVASQLTITNSEGFTLTLAECYLSLHITCSLGRGVAGAGTRLQLSAAAGQCQGSSVQTQKSSGGPAEALS